MPKGNKDSDVYHVVIHCKNCCDTFLVTEAKGKRILDKAMCPSCQCDTDTNYREVYYDRTE